ncbi:MAG: hypothetical protein FJ014_03690 [Chloroflexi bacterium]|nr:hypothetical protein [Chloroflexota bacterium]
MPGFQKLLLVLCSLVIIWPASDTGAAIFRGDIITVTVSGTVTGPNGPVPDVWIDVNASPSGLPYGASTFTDSNGFYSVTVQTGGILNLHARPPLDSRLAEVNMRRDGITDSFTHDFTTTAGYLLSLRPTDEAGQPLSMTNWQLLAYSVLTATPPGYLREYHLMWDEAVGRYECVLPPDVYSVDIDTPPAGYLPTTTVFDLRNTDQVTNLVFSHTSFNPTISYPPDVSKITIGPPDGLGEALVTGAPGAVVPTGHIMLTNLSSWHRINAVSSPDGSFSARIYAPPGSALYIQHGSLQWLSRLATTSEAYEVYPGTLINLPHTHSAPPGTTPFAAAGAVEFVSESAGIGPHVSAAWAMTGTLRSSGNSGVNTALSPTRYAPGDSFHAEGAMCIYGPGITSTTDVSGISASGGLSLRMLGNRDGVPLAPHNPAITTRLTVSGFPIRDPYTNDLGLGCGFEVGGLHCSGDHAIEGSFAVDCQIPQDTPPGTYRPVIGLSFSGVPTSTQWLGPNGEISYRNFQLNEAPLPPIVVAGATQAIAAVRLPWRLMIEDNVQGVRGVGAREDVGKIGLLSFIVTQDTSYIAPPVDYRTGISITYSLEPNLPLVTSNVSSLYLPPSPPLIPFSLPGGSLSVVIRRPDGTIQDLGHEALAQSLLRAKITWGGFPLNTGVNSGTTRVDHAYSLRAASDRFRGAFDQYGHHVITVTDEVSDLWGNRYAGGGTYDVWVAEPLDMDPGVLPGTPFDVGDTFNPTVQLYPGVPALVEWMVTEYPNSDPARAIRHTIGGWANRFGYFNGRGFAFSSPGEYRVDLVARYVDEDGVMWMGAMTWGGVVMTPSAQAQLIAHGRRGINNLVHIPGPWFVFCRDLTFISGATPHTYAPYFNGDVIWSRQEPIYECSGEALQTGGSIQDTVGALEARIRQRFERMSPPLDLPGDLNERFGYGEIPLISSTRSGRPPQMFPEEMDQIAYMYFYSERPGVRVREDITEDYTFPAGYWRFDTLYDDQMGVGILGDLPNDYKFQYIGAVYRDLETGHSEYLGQGTGWILLSDDDPLGSRVMPPFAGPGNGGWTTEGGPLMRLKGQDVHIFIQPTGILPGAVLQVGDTFRFAGHIMPTLDSRVAFTVTAPSGVQHLGGGRANRIGYFYNPTDDFVVGEPGLWMVDVHVWHDGLCSGGQTIPPYPSGDVLGSEDGRYWFYVVQRDAPRLDVSTPAPGFLSFPGGVTPITISGTVPITLTGAVVDYTITMPGFILEHGQVSAANGTYTVVFDPVALARDFPNLDLIGRDARNLPGLADTFAIGLLLRGRDAGGNLAYRANSIVLQGEQVFVGHVAEPSLFKIFMPVILKR